MTGCSTASTSVGGAADRVGEALGYRFQRPRLVEEALTHPSALTREHDRRGRRRPAKTHYERLEFLGDRVLGLVIADLLWRRFESESEGALTRRYASLVRREALARVAQAVDLGRSIVLSPAESAAGTAGNPGILADALEAVIAAVYLDGGFAAAAEVIHRLWEPLVETMEAPPRDPKTALQEWVQARGLPLPAYELVAASGPDHAPVFTVAVHVTGIEAATAAASSKRLAEAAAASALLDRIAARN